MRKPPDEVRGREKMTEWGKAQLAVRAMILTSSRARRDAAVDLLSDYDLVLAVTDLERFQK